MADPIAQRTSSGARRRNVLHGGVLIPLFPLRNRPPMPVVPALIMSSVVLFSGVRAYLNLLERQGWEARIQTAEEEFRMNPAKPELA